MTRGSRRRWPFVVAAAFAVLLLTVGLIVGRSKLSGGDPNAAPTPIAAAELGGTGPGSLLSAETMPALASTPEGGILRAARVVYRSTEGDTGAPTIVSGAVFTPLGRAPGGGWPVVAIGHGTTGLDEPCAPSLSPTMLNMSSLVAAQVGQGYAVAFTDYQGLGHDGIHPYTDARTAGLNVIDSVRALRKTFPDVSKRWAAFGGSQGGGATWAADEQAASYAPELDLVGAVAISPAADLTGLIDKAQAGTMTKDQAPAVQGIVESLARLHPDLDRDDYRRGGAARYWDVLSACAGPLVDDRTAAVEALGARDFVSSPEAADRLRGYLKAWALPQRQLSAPLLVAYGGADTYVDPGWTAAAITRACQLGGIVNWNFDPNAKHSEADVGALNTWVADRFAGEPVTNECA